VETAIEEAKETCDTGSTGECAAAWDTVVCAFWVCCFLCTTLGTALC
jgi:CP12 domain